MQLITSPVIPGFAIAIFLHLRQSLCSASSRLPLKPATVMLRLILAVLSGSHGSYTSSKHFQHITCRGTIICLCSVIGLVRRSAAVPCGFAICLGRAVASALRRPEATVHSPKPDCSSTDRITTCVACACAFGSETETGKRMHPLSAMLADKRHENSPFSMRSTTHMHEILLGERYIRRLFVSHAHLCISVTAPGKTLLL